MVDNYLYMLLDFTTYPKAYLNNFTTPSRTLVIRKKKERKLLLLLLICDTIVDNSHVEKTTIMPTREVNVQNKDIATNQEEGKMENNDAYSDDKYT